MSAFLFVDISKKKQPFKRLLVSVTRFRIFGARLDYFKKIIFRKSSRLSP